MPRRNGAPPSLYMSWLEMMTRKMPPFLLLRGNQTSVLTFYSWLEKSDIWRFANEDKDATKNRFHNIPQKRYFPPAAIVMLNLNFIFRNKTTSI